jgi:hypothetical protein
VVYMHQSLGGSCNGVVQLAYVLTLCVLGYVRLDQPPLNAPSRILLVAKEANSIG